MQFATLTSNMKKWLTEGGADVVEDISDKTEFKVSDDTNIIILKGTNEKWACCLFHPVILEKYEGKQLKETLFLIGPVIFYWL